MEGSHASRILWRALSFAFCVAALQVVVVESAVAQDAEAEAEYHVKRGRAFHAEGQYSQAISEFDRAYSLNPSYEYLPEIARTHEALGNHQRAIEAYQAYLRKGGKKLGAAERKRVRSEIERLEKAKTAAANADQARRHFEAGDAYYQQGKNGLALIEYERAYELTGDPEYLEYMAEACVEKGDKKQAVKHYRRYLDEAGSLMSGAERVAIEQGIALLEGKPTPPTHAAPPTPATSASPSTPSTPVVTGPWEHYFYVGFGYERMGKPAAAIEAFEKYLAGGAGKIDPVREAEVREALARLRGGGSLPASGTPTPEATGPTPASSAPATVVDDEESGGRVWTWVCFGIGGAAAVGAAVTGTIALIKEEDVRSQCDGNACPATTFNDIKQIQTLGPVTDVLIGVAAAGVITGVILYFVEGGDESETAVGLAPLPSGGGALSVGGRF